MTTTGAHSANAYLRTKVMTASREELRLMLLDGAIKFANQAKDGMQRKDFEACFTGVTNCRNIIVELMTTIRPEHNPTLAEQVRALYTYMFRELSEAQLNKDTKHFDTVIQLLEYDRQTWVMLMEQLAAERAAGRDPVADAQAAAAPTAEIGQAAPAHNARPSLSISG